MEFKYDFNNLEKVEVKQSFTVHKTDTEGDVEETLDIPFGTKATIYSMDSSSINNYEKTYDFEAEIDGREITFTVLEDNVEEYFTIN